MQIKRQFTVNASANKVWDIIGHQFDRVSDWASGVYASHGIKTDAVFQDAAYSGRTCETKIGFLNETITQYDEQQKIVAYKAKGDKMPFFVKGMSNCWTVTPIGPNQTQVDMCMEAALLPVFNLVMGPMMRLQMGGLISQTIEEFQYFAEKGMPHPRKLEAKENMQLKGA